METWVIIAIIVGVILLLASAFGSANLVFGCRGKSNGNAQNSYAYSSCGGGSDGQLVLFYTDWCGYCKDIKPTWNKLQKEFGSTLVGIDADKQSALKRSYGVRGYPSIYWCPKGLKHSTDIAEPYSGNRDEESIRNFINEKMH